MYSSEQGPLGPTGPASQKFSERGQPTIRSRGTPTACHSSIASSSGPSPSRSSPANTVTQMSSGSKREHLQREVPREADRLGLEVGADREVAEHLEEREVAQGAADVVDVGRAKALLAARQHRRGRLVAAEEVGLQRLHAGGREQHRAIVRRAAPARPRECAGARARRRSRESARGSRPRSSTR